MRKDSRQYAVSSKQKNNRFWRLPRTVLVQGLLFTVFCLLPTAYCLLFSPAVGLGQYGSSAPGLEKPAVEVPTTERPVEIWVFPSTQRLVTGKTLLLTVQVIWRLGINVVLEDLEKVDLSPFKVEKVTVGERQIFENERDFRVVQYLLSLPEGAKEG
ncbi:MAG: hypothetical protein ACK4WF_08865, partial [Candidatus Brocadiales bacterium]